MPFGRSTPGGEFNVDPGKFSEDDKIRKAPQENLPHARLVRAITTIVTLGVLAWLFWMLINV